MENYLFEIDEPIKVRCKLSVKGLRGKIMYLEKVVDVNGVPFSEWNWALNNYFDRRGFKWYIPSFAFYGHAEDGLGYFIGLDEIWKVYGDNKCLK